MIRLTSTRYLRPLRELPMSIEWKVVFAYDTSFPPYSPFREHVNFVHMVVGNHNGTDRTASTASFWMDIPSDYYCYYYN